MKNYITIGNLCIGFGKPPADLLAQRIEGKPSFPSNAWARMHDEIEAEYGDYDESED